MCVYVCRFVTVQHTDGNTAKQILIYTYDKKTNELHHNDGNTAIDNLRVVIGMEQVTCSRHESYDIDMAHMMGIELTLRGLFILYRVGKRHRIYFE